MAIKRRNKSRYQKKFKTKIELISVEEKTEPIISETNPPSYIVENTNSSNITPACASVRNGSTSAQNEQIWTEEQRIAKANAYSHYGHVSASSYYNFIPITTTGFFQNQNERSKNEPLSNKKDQSFHDE